MQEEFIKYFNNYFGKDVETFQELEEETWDMYDNEEEDLLSYLLELMHVFLRDMEGADY